jgi:hypothetical protein
LIPLQESSVEVPISPSTKSAQIRFVLLEPISSATAVSGQQLRFAVDQDVTVNGTVVIRRGTLATGVVSHVTKAIPGKRDGFITVEPRTTSLVNGYSAKLARNLPGEDDCGDMGPCVGLAAFVVIVSPIIAGILVVESPFLIAHAIHNAHHHKLTPPAVKGKDEDLEACSTETAYFHPNSKILSQLSSLQSAPRTLADQPVLAQLETCREQHSQHTIHRDSSGRDMENAGSERHLK